MESKIRKFFQKKKAEATFKLAGPGRKLNAPDEPKQVTKNKDAYNPPSRSGLTSEAEQAAAAALARIEKRMPTPGFNTSFAAIRAQAKSEIEAEKLAAMQVKTEEKPEPPELPSRLAVDGVFFRCPVISDEILSQDEWMAKIREFLYEQLSLDPGLTAVLMIYSLNKNSEKVKTAVETLTKYLENIIQQPSEEKYRKIRKSNKAFMERVAPIEGTTLFLEGAGFKSDGDFYVFPDEAINDESIGNLEMLIDAFKSAEPISLQLERNLRVLLPSQAKSQTDLPREFFFILPEDLKREQQAKIDAIEKSSMLMTKAMREKEEQRELRNYRYCLIRVRFPDGIILQVSKQKLCLFSGITISDNLAALLRAKPGAANENPILSCAHFSDQGTFGVHEPLKSVKDFVKEALENPDILFSFTTPFGEKFENTEDKSLFELRLIPASILIFISKIETNLKPDIMILCQED